MIKTVIFDFDGVIADSLPYHFKQMIEIAKKEFNIKESEKKIINEIRSKSYSELMKTFKISWTKLPYIFSIINKAREHLFNNIEKIKIFSGMKTLFNSLKNKGIKIMILSSNLEKTILKFIDLNNIDLFDEISCDAALLGKASAISYFLKKNKINKDEVIYVGDEIRDVEACNKIKVKIIAVSWGFQEPKILKEKGADFIAKKPSDILKIISKN